MSTIGTIKEPVWLVRVGKDPAFRAGATETALELICGRIMGHAVLVTDTEGRHPKTQDGLWLPHVKRDELVAQAYTLAQLKTLEQVRVAILRASVRATEDAAVYHLSDGRPRLALGDRHGLFCFVLLDITREPWRVTPTLHVVHKQDASDTPIFTTKDPTEAGIHMALRLHERHIRAKVARLGGGEMHQSHKVRTPDGGFADPWTVHTRGGIPEIDEQAN